MKAKISYVLIVMLVLCYMVLGLLLIFLAAETWHLSAPTAWKDCGNGHVCLSRSKDEITWMIMSFINSGVVALYWFQLGFIFQDIKGNKTFRQLITEKS